MILVGVLDIAGAGWLPKEMARFMGRYTRYSWGLSGIIFIIVGIAIILFPGPTILAIVLIVGIIAIIVGLLSILSAATGRAG
jgi:uncharacterized membrane protein HdeD (DUF308 family)